MIHFESTKEEGPDEEQSIAEMKQLAQRAMNALEDGKQVAAFNLLKKIVAE